MQVGELFVALGFQVDDKSLKEFNDNIKAGTKFLGAMTATAAGTVYAINRFTASSVDSSVKLKNLSDQTQTATDDVQRFYNVAGRLNTQITLDDTINAFQQLSDVIAEAKLGKGPIGEAGMLGLDNIGSMTPMAVIRQLRENYKNNVKAWGQGDERVIQNLMKSIGLGPEFIQAIKATDDQFTQLWENPILNGDARAKLVEVAKAEKEVNFQWELLKGNFSAEFSPAIIEFLTNLNALLGKTTEQAGKTGEAIKQFQKKTGTNDSQMRTIGNAAALETGLGLMAVPSPFFATQALGGTIILGTGINDVGKYIRGKPSTTGDMIDVFGTKFENFKQSIIEELMKTKAEQEEDRRRLLNDQPLDNKGFGRYNSGPTSFNQTNNINVSSTADERSVAMAVVDELNNRRFREMEFNMGFNASGMQA